MSISEHTPRKTSAKAHVKSLKNHVTSPRSEIFHGVMKMSISADVVANDHISIISNRSGRVIWAQAVIKQHAIFNVIS